jgi:hypothetical protein
MVKKSTINCSTASELDIDLHLNALGQARQFLETCGTQNLLYRMKFVYFLANLLFLPKQPKNNKKSTK